jgi:sugar phosphate isomerase/epimerase
VHAGSYPSLRRANEAEDAFAEEYQEHFISVLYDNLSFLADRTRSILLCVENCGFTGLTMSVMERLLSDHDKVFLSWDIAKTYSRDLRLDESVEEFMRAHLARIREVHAHDIVPGFRSHQIVGEGGLDFRPYAKIINSPDVAVTVEVRPREAAKVSRDNLIAMLASSAE